MWRILKKLRNIVGTIVLSLAGLALVTVIALWIVRPGIADKTILEVDLEQELIEYIPDDPVAMALTRDKTQLRDVVEAIEKAAGDKRVIALIARIGSAPLGLAKIQELRDAVLVFRAAGKKTIAHAETFGEGGSGNGAYYLATAFEKIFLQPSGDVTLTGLLFESPFIRGALDKLGITPRLDHRHEYKNAKNLFTERKYTDAHREATEAVMKAWHRQMIRGIASGRGINEERVRDLIAAGPYYGKEALAAKLVDGLAYRDEVYAQFRKPSAEGGQLLYLSKYLKRAGRPHDSGETIALIYGVGGVQRGKSGYDPLFQNVTMGSDSVASAIRAAVEDEDVKAIVFRIDSPGGSYVASDTIWRETLRAREVNKPIIVSMGNVAGSGGYFVAMAADKIVAQPGTITGSIGVLGGKMLTSGFWDKLGVSWDHVATSDNATMLTGTQDYDKEGWRRFQDALDRIYEDFTTKVAAGRNLSKKRVLEIAKGRIWAGEDAKALGLVDELGGYATALRLARQAAGLDDDAPVKLKLFPEPKSLVSQILEEDPDSSDEAIAISMVRQILVGLKPLLRIAGQIRLFRNDSSMLTTPELATRQ